MEQRIKGLAHIGIQVSDLERSKAFYQKLGFTLDREEAIENRLKLAFLNAGSCILELMEPAKRDDSALKSGVIEHIALEVDDLNAAVAAAITNGIEIDAKTAMRVDICGGIRNIFFEGPDGEGLEFFEFLKKL